MKLSETIAVLSALKTELGDADPEVAFSDEAKTVHDVSDIAIQGAFNQQTKKLDMIVDIQLKKS